MIKVVKKVIRMHHRQCSFFLNLGEDPQTPRKKVPLKSLWASHMPELLHVVA